MVGGAHLIAEIHNDSPYAGIASIKSIKTCMFLSDLKELLLWMADVENAYLETWTKEKLCFVDGP